MTGAPDETTTGLDGLTALAPRSVLHLGSEGPVAQWASDTHTTALDAGAAATAQLHDRFECMVVTAHALNNVASNRRAVLHTAVQHLDREGHLAVAHSGEEAIGGIQAWRAAGLPLVPPDHTFLEL